jgi:hypothetical protein
VDYKRNPTTAFRFLLYTLRSGQISVKIAITVVNTVALDVGG